LEVPKPAQHGFQRQILRQVRRSLAAATLKQPQRPGQTYSRWRKGTTAATLSLETAPVNVTIIPVMRVYVQVDDS
jgi:hypothetical protein